MLKNYMHVWIYAKQFNSVIIYIFLYISDWDINFKNLV